MNHKNAVAARAPLVLRWAYPLEALSQPFNWFVIGLIGVLGFLAGQGLARVLGRVVFGSDVAVNWLLLPIMLLVALAVTFAGTWLPLRRVARFQPATVLRGE